MAGTPAPERRPQMLPGRSPSGGVYMGFCSFFESKFKAPKTPPSHGLAGLAAIKAGAKSGKTLCSQALGGFDGFSGNWLAATGHLKSCPQAIAGKAIGGDAVWPFYGPFYGPFVWGFRRRWQAGRRTQNQLLPVRGRVGMGVFFAKSLFLYA